MIKRTLGEFALMCGGELSSSGSNIELRAAGVTTDSRRSAEGQLFVPLSGERFDGHDYAAQAFDQGALAAVWQADRPVPEQLCDQPLILVDNPLAALQRLAAAYRRQLPVRVIGITGSNGKTTTKDLAAAALAAAFRVHKTEGNLNNHIGLPLTILALDEDTDFAVLEMGMSGFGEIELLSSIAAPDVAIITNIGDAHLLQLGSREGIAKAKLEIISGLRQDGLLLINGDEPLLRSGLNVLTLPAGAEVQSFGLGAGNDWTADSIRIESAASSFTVRTAKASIQESFRIPVPGKHNISNALAAVALAEHFGVPQNRLREGLASVKLTGMRIETVGAYNGATVLNDAYNANPTAVKAAIRLVSELSGYRRKWLVLADMLELGPDEITLHLETGRLITPDVADCVVTYGNLARNIAEGAAERLPAEAVRHFEDKEQLKTWLRDAVSPDDLILVKGSRGMRMEEIVQALEC